MLLKSGWQHVLLLDASLDLLLPRDVAPKHLRMRQLQCIVGEGWFGADKSSALTLLSVLQRLGA